MITENKQAAAERRAEVDAFVAARGPDAAAWVRDYCDSHGQGPRWFELGQSLGLEYTRWALTIRIAW